MGYWVEGTADVPLEEFWSFVRERTGVDTDSFGQVFLDPGAQEMAVEVRREQLTEEHFIDLVDFWSWVEGYVPFVRDGAETRYGVPRIDPGLGSLTLSVVANTAASPDTMTPCPSALLEWRGLTGARVPLKRPEPSSAGGSADADRSAAQDGKHTLERFAADTREGIERFVAHWRAQHAMHPEEYPLELGPGEWDEQFFFFDPYVPAAGRSRRR